jgi:hypothetical protein
MLLPTKVVAVSSSAASKVGNVGFPLQFGRSSRSRTATVVVCLALIVLAAAVQVMHHCTALELNQEPGSTSVFCAVCMTLQVATLAVAALAIAIRRLPGVEPIALPQIAPEFGTCFALSVRPPPSR